MCSSDLGSGWTQENAVDCIAGRYGTYTVAYTAGGPFLKDPYFRVQIGYAVTDATITDPGSGYTQQGVNLPLVFTKNGVDIEGGGGTGFARIGFAVASVQVTNPGSNYTSASVTFTPQIGDTGVDAAGDVTLGYTIQTEIGRAHV